MINLDKKLHRFLTILLYVGLLTGFIITIFLNKQPLFYPLIILTLITLLASFSHFKYYRYDAVNDKAKVFIIINMILTFVFLYFNYTDYRQIFLLILIGDCIFAFPKSFSTKYVIMTYIVYYPYIYFVYEYNFNWNYATAFVDDIVISIFCIIILSLVKSQINVNVKNNDLIIDRDKAYHQLEKYATKIEDLAKVEERNRIALVLHNSIGHSLTSIMLSLQAEKMELIREEGIPKDSFKDVEKLIQEAMALLRKTIENADDFTQAMPFDDILDCFIRDASNNTKVNINYSSINASFVLDHQKSVILNVVTESITNALKHSGCKTINVNITGNIKGITLDIKDDGCGFETIEYGFGITKTIQQVTRLDGRYTITSHNGCLIQVFLPIKEVTKNV